MYFPTSIPMPLPVLCHATLALEQNRKRAQQVDANAYVLSVLAEFVAETAEEISKEAGGLWQGLDLIKARMGFAEDLRNFEKRLFECARTKRIVPTLNGELARPDESRFLRRANQDWLPVSLFQDVAGARDDSDVALYHRLGSCELEAETFVERIRKTPELGLDPRVALVAGLVRYGLPAEYRCRELLLDSTGAVIDEHDILFLPPQTSATPQAMPGWARVRLLNAELWQRLSSALDVGRVREARHLLVDFGVQEYALGNLVSRLAASANRVIEAEPSEESRIRRELLGTLLKLLSGIPPEKRPSFPENTSVKLLNQEGEWIEADKLYLGDGYPPHGHIVQELYTGQRTKLVALHVDVYGDADPVTLRETLLWMGVAEWPREIQLKQASQEFLDFVLGRIAYPAHFVWREMHEVYQTRDAIPWPQLTKVVSLEGLDTIIGASPVALLAWLAHDPRADAWMESRGEHGRLQCRPPSRQYDWTFDGTLPGYIHFVLKRSHWLPSVGGTRLRPTDYLLSDHSIGDIFPKPLPPSTSEVARYGLDRNRWVRALQRAGVPLGLAYLDSETIYALLLELPEKNPDGKAAKQLYRWLLESSDIEPDITGRNYAKFVVEGKMWGRYRQVEEYHPIDELVHVDVEGLPDALLDSLPVVMLPKRRGVNRVTRLFGVTAIGRNEVRQTVEHHTAAVEAPEADCRFQEARTYLLALRRANNAPSQQLEQIRWLMLEVSTEVTTLITFRNQEFRARLRPWGYAFQDDRLFVAVDPSRPTQVSRGLLANAVGTAIAALCGLADGSAFAQIYQCEEPDRRSLLMCLLGEEREVEVDAWIGSGLESMPEEPTLFVPSEALTTSRGDAGQGPVGGAGDIDKPATAGDVTNPPDETEGEEKWEIPQAVSSEPVSHVPEPPGKPIQLSVRDHALGAGFGGGRRYPGVSPAVGEAGERLAELFEESQGRFPTRVGGITGYQGFGCDVVSFRSAEDRELFRRGGTDAQSIDRFIEAKARTQGSVDLTGNELNAARKWRERYFIYRFQRESGTPSDYLLTILQDPIAAYEAQTPVIHFSLERAVASKKYRLSSGTKSQE